MCFICSDCGNRELESLESLPNGEVREWLSSTFTRMDSTYQQDHGNRVTFKAVAQAVAIGHYIGQ